MADYPPPQGYPPAQNPSYPPENPGYPAQDPRYPPQDSYGYPGQEPPQQAYPVQQPPVGAPSAPYPVDPYKQSVPDQQGFSAQAAAPPPYYSQQQTAYPMQQPPRQQQARTVVVQQQPQPAVIGRRYRGDTATGPLIFAIVVTFFGLFTGCFWVLVCSLPALLFAFNAQSAGNRGDDDSARNNERLSICCSVGAVVFAVLGVLGIIGGIVGWYVWLISL